MVIFLVYFTKNLEWYNWNEIYIFPIMKSNNTIIQKIIDYNDTFILENFYLYFRG